MASHQASTRLKLGGDAEAGHGSKVAEAAFDGHWCIPVYLTFDIDCRSGFAVVDRADATIERKIAVEKLNEAERRKLLLSRP